MLPTTRSLTTASPTPYGQRPMTFEKRSSRPTQQRSAARTTQAKAKATKSYSADANWLSTEVACRGQLLPAEPNSGGPHQRQHRGVHLRKLIMIKPAYVQRLLADARADRPTREHEILHVEVVAGAYRTTRYFVQ